MGKRSDEPDDAGQDEPPKPPEREGERRPGTGKAEPEKAKAEIEAGDVADDLADFA